MTGKADFLKKILNHNLYHKIPGLTCCGAPGWLSVSAPPLSQTSLIPPERLRSGMKTHLLPPAGILAPVSVFVFPDGLMCQRHIKQHHDIWPKNNVLTLILVAFWTLLSTEPGLLGNTGDLSSTHISHM